MSTQKISLKRLKYSAKANFEHNSAAAASPEFYRSRAFSKDGFIEDQNALNLACGARSAAYCGCGFIAAYNLLSTAGAPPEIPVLISEFEHGLVLGGVLGTRPLFMLRFLRRNFSSAKLYLSPRRFLQGAPRRGVIFYMRRDFSAHYTAFTAAPDGKLRFYNYRGTGFTQPAADFFSEKDRRLFLCYAVE